MRDIKNKLPLRLILTTRCNGKCCFCHREGFDPIDYDMEEQVLNESIRAAKEIGICNISLTGGEPTLREDLSDIVKKIHILSSNIHVSITTNGISLSDFNKRNKVRVYRINLSMVSLIEERALRYQNVCPDEALNALLESQVDNKVINIYVMEENIDEIDSFVKIALDKGINIDFMFDSDSSQELYESLYMKLSQITSPKIDYSNIITLGFRVNHNVTLRIKHPKFSAINKYRVCENCKKQNDCFEGICAVRVYPDTMVTPCLHQVIYEKNSNMTESIQTVYKFLESDQRECRKSD